MASIVPTNCKIELISDIAIEQFWFHAQDYVSATLGTKSGPVCAPLLKYKVLSDDSIELFDQNGTIAVWTGIKVDAETLQVECRGEIRLFTITRQSTHT